MSDEVDAVVVDDPNVEVTPVDVDNTPKDPGYMAAVKNDLISKYGEDLRKYPNINPIIEDYFTLKAKSEGAIVKPKEGASEEEVSKYKELMGIPANAEGYELEKVDPSFDGWFKDTAVKASLDTSQATIVNQAWIRMLQDGQDAQEAASKEAEKSMKTELGSGYDGAMANAEKVLEMGGEGLRAWLNESGAGNDPRMIRVFTKLGAMISEDSINTVGHHGEGNGLTLAERLYPNHVK